MKKIILILILILMPLVSIAEMKDTSQIDGYAWDKMNNTEKLSFITGFLSGTNYVISKRVTYIIDGYDENKAKVLFNDMVADMKNKKPEQCFTSDQVILISSYINILSKDAPERYSILGITNGQLTEGINLLYKDFKNKQIKLNNAIYVIRKQITGSPPEDIERILLYLRSDRKEEYLQIRNEKGEVIRIISFP